jgi:hypothetical protein
MSDLSQQDNESTAIAENTDVNSDCSLGIKARGRIVVSKIIHYHQSVRRKFLRSDSSLPKAHTTLMSD